MNELERLGDVEAAHALFDAVCGQTPGLGEVMARIGWDKDCPVWVEAVAALGAAGLFIGKPKPEPEVRLLRIKVFRYGLHFKPMLYSEEYVNTGGLPGRVRVGPFTFAGRAEVHVQDCMSISTGFNAGEVVRFDEDDAGEWTSYQAGWYP